MRITVTHSKAGYLADGFRAGCELREVPVAKLLRAKPMKVGDAELRGYRGAIPTTLAGPPANPIVPASLMPFLVRGKGSPDPPPPGAGLPGAF